jgi:hypothetical protein
MRRASAKGFRAWRGAGIDGSLGQRHQIGNDGTGRGFSLSALGRLQRLIVLERSAPAFGSELTQEHRQLRRWWSELEQPQKDGLLKQSKSAEGKAGRRA